MKTIKLMIMAALAAAATGFALQMGAGAEGVVETAREIPLAYDVDVVIAGGSVAGVEAACAAADSGASVLVVESRPYLGYDLCANQKLWLNPEEQPQTELTQWLFKDSRQVTPLQVKSLLPSFRILVLISMSSPSLKSLELYPTISMETIEKT